MFPIDSEIGPLDRLESLTVELRWKDIGFDRFRLEDDRQHVVERSQEGTDTGRWCGSSPPGRSTSPARLPITGPEFAPDLGESRYIKPRDPKIVAVAREVTRGKADALEAVKATLRLGLQERRDRTTSPRRSRGPRSWRAARASAASSPRCSPRWRGRPASPRGSSWATGSSRASGAGTCGTRSTSAAGSRSTRATTRSASRPHC